MYLISPFGYALTMFFGDFEHASIIWLDRTHVAIVDLVKRISLFESQGEFLWLVIVVKRNDNDAVFRRVIGGDDILVRKCYGMTLDMIGEQLAVYSLRVALKSGVLFRKIPLDGCVYVEHSAFSVAVDGNEGKVFAVIDQNRGGGWLCEDGSRAGEVDGFFVDNSTERFRGAIGIYDFKSCQIFKAAEY